MVCSWPEAAAITHPAPAGCLVSEKGNTLQLRDNALQYVGDPEAPRPSWKGLKWRSLLSLKWRQDDNESVFCCVLFMALFVADFSFLAMVFPIVLYLYALLAQAPATRFWQVGTMASFGCLQCMPTSAARVTSLPDTTMLHACSRWEWPVLHSLAAFSNV